MHRVTLLLLGLVMVLGLVNPAAAQVRDRVEEELRNTDEGLAQAREIVLESRSARAANIFQSAVRLQERAWEEFRSDRLLVAGKLTREAREVGMRALSTAREDGRLSQRAQRELEKGVTALTLARESFDGAPSDQARRLLEEARAQLERGRAQYQEANYEPAIRLAVSAQRLVKQALGTDAGTSVDLVLRQLERTDNLIQRVRDAVRESGDEDAARVLGQAQELQGKAWEAQRAGRLRMAYATTREARSIANRAAALIRGSVDGDTAAAALEETDRLLDRAREIIRDAGDERARKLLEKGTEHQVRAKDLLRDRDVRASLAETRVARSLAKRALSIAEGGSGI